MSRPHIVILGAGFGGMYIAKELKRMVKRGLIDLTIINRTNYFLFTPLLHEVATGSLGPRNVAEPLREVFAKTGIHIVQGCVQHISPNKRIVTVHDNLTTRHISYDYLVVATGAETNYFGVPGAEQTVFPLKTLADAVRIRSRIIDCCEQAVLSDDSAERIRLLSFAVVGGGATGVETAAELADFVQGMVKRYYSKGENCLPGDRRHCDPEEPKLSLVHMGPELLEQFAPKLRKAAADRLTKSGVSLHLGTTVTSVQDTGLVISTGNKSIPAGTVIWTAGVKAVIPQFEDKQPALVAGRLVVDKYFRLIDNDRIFAIGDVAGYVDMDSPAGAANADAPVNTKPSPMLAQVAVAQSKVVAANLIAALRAKPLTVFHYHSKGSMVSVGQWFAIGEIFSLHIAGRITWWLWRTVYLFKFASWQKRIRIAFEWTLEIFYPRDITKLD